MSDFKGITQDTLFLMQLNRFNDSKAFYEENKEKIKANMTVPMRQIAASLSDMMLDIEDALGFTFKHMDLPRDPTLQDVVDLVHASMAQPGG